MNMIRIILAVALLAWNAPAEPVALADVVNVTAMRQMGIPGIPPGTSDHVRVLLRPAQPGLVAVHVKLLIDGRQVDATTIVDVNEMGAWAIFPIEDASVTSVIDAQYEAVL